MIAKTESNKTSEKSREILKNHGIINKWKKGKKNRKSFMGPIRKM